MSLLRGKKKVDFSLMDEDQYREHVRAEIRLARERAAQPAAARTGFMTYVVTFILVASVMAVLVFQMGWAEPDKLIQATKTETSS